MRILFILHTKDINYVKWIKSSAPGFVTSGKVVTGTDISYLSEVDALCTTNKCDAIVCTDYHVLKILFPQKKFKDTDTDGQGLTINDFQGNVAYTPKGKKIVFVAPLRQLVTVPHASFLFHRFISKLENTRSKRFLTLPHMNPVYCDTVPKMEECVEVLRTSKLIAFDIETSKNQRITHISFADERNNVFSFTVKDMLDLKYIRQILMNDALKIAQNGKYDCLHLLHWNSPINNYYFDTYGLFCAWLSELPRSLDFIGSFFLDDLLYWKDESATDMALYNAKDTHVTLWAFIAFMREAPQWAKDNYATKFKTFFPHLSSEFQGLAVDQDVLESLTLKHRKIIDDSLDSLNACIGTKTFNPGSSKQVKSLLSVLAPKEKIESSDEAALKHIASKHPLNAHIIGKILSYRESLKLHSTYLDATLWHGRITYSLDAFGTETGRSACRASSFGEPIKQKKNGEFQWKSYGVQVQNIPRSFKVCVKADKDFLLVEMDKSQAESRCTAYLAQEPALIDAVEHSPDFHCHNASAFFGIPFEELYDVETHKKLNVPIRDLAKRVNHGANYNMGVNVLIQTMGEENMWKAKALLKLNPTWTLKQVAQHLLDAFDSTYPRLRDKHNGWYGELIAEWANNGGLIRTPDGWTRKFFGDPINNKSALNELVAHSPQHLNVALVDEGYFRIWHELDDPATFRVCGQIHDSVLFQVHKDHQHLIQKAKEIYDSTASITIHGREMFIPSDVSGPKEHWK